MDKKNINKFKRLVAPYGVTVEGKGGHMAVLHNGKRISTLSHTGHGNTFRLSIQHLAREGVVPDDLRREKFS